jgi:hypothetical protein
MNIIKSGLSLLFLCLSQTATAGLLTFDDNNLGEIYAENEVIRGSFDLTSFLSGDDYIFPYNIASASITFNFRDDDDIITTNTLTDYKYSGEFDFEPENIQVFTRHRYTEYFSPTETFHVYDGLVKVSHQTDYYSRGGVRTGTEGIKNESDDGKTISIYDTVNYTDRHHGLTGQWEYTTQYSGFDLYSALLFRGVINYQTEITGSGYLTSAVLNLDITPNPIEEVSEPSTLAIFALGMIGLTLRRFKKKS